MQGLRLIPITGNCHDIAVFLSLSLAEIFAVPCELVSAVISVADCYSSERRQYHSTPILQRLLPFGEGSRNHVLGIMDADLYIPILTFVFGEAQLGKSCALISAARLHQSFYGLPEDESLLLQRCEKEAVHELGHTLGLTHCRNFECVMHFSHGIEYTDLKRNAFCPDCARRAGLACRW